MPSLRMSRRGTACSAGIRAQMTQQEISEAIACKARELYEKSGMKSGHDLDNWLEAERIVRSQMARGK